MINGSRRPWAQASSTKRYGKARRKTRKPPSWSCRSVLGLPGQVVGTPTEFDLWINYRYKIRGFYVAERSDQGQMHQTAMRNGRVWQKTGETRCELTMDPASTRPISLIEKPPGRVLQDPSSTHLQLPSGRPTGKEGNNTYTIPSLS